MLEGTWATDTVSPRMLLRQDRRSAMIVAVTAGLGVGIVFGLGFPPLSAIGVGVPAGIGFAIVVTMLRAPWLSYALARNWLALHGSLPWRLMGFLGRRPPARRTPPGRHGVPIQAHRSPAPTRPNISTFAVASPVPGGVVDRQPRGWLYWPTRRPTYSADTDARSCHDRAQPPSVAWLAPELDILCAAHSRWRRLLAGTESAFWVSM